MVRSIVGLDLDHTLVRFRENFWDEAARMLHMKPGSIKPPTKYGISQYTRTIQNTVYKLFTAPLYMGDLQSLPFAGMFVDWLNQRGNTVFVISARHKSVRNSGVRFVTNRIAVSSENFHYVNPGESKEDVFRKLELDYWVDDNELDITIAIDMGIQAFHIINTPWGKNEVDGAVRVKGLFQIMDYFNKAERNG